MSLFKSSGNNMEEFFRREAEKHPFEYDPTAWSKMQAKLDAHDGKTPPPRNGRYKWRSFLLTLGLLSPLYFGLNRVLPVGLPYENPIEVAAASSVGEPAQETQTETLLGNKQTSINQNRKEESPEATYEQIALVDESKSEENGAVEKTSEAARTDARPSTLPPDLLAEQKEMGQVSRAAVPIGGQQKDGSLEEDIAASDRVRGDALQPSGLQEISSKGLFLLPVEAISPFSDSTAETSGLLSGARGNLETLSNQSGKRLGRWSILATISPDMSFIGFSNVESPGMLGGLLTEYQLSDRFAVNAGVLYSRKVYLAEGDAYTPPKGFWYGGAIPDYADGVCNMLDLPINIKYDAFRGNRHRFFISGGFTSYIILRERYEFYSAQQSEYGNTQGSYGWEGTNTEQHYFSMLNLSAGWEKSLSPQMALRVEPFLKMPLTGIGFGDVQLQTAGVFLSLRYQWLRGF